MGRVEPRVQRHQRHARLRAKIEGTTSRPRLCVFRSLNHTYAQVIDDGQRHTLVAASTLDAELTGQLTGKVKTAKAELVGSLLAKRALAQGIKEVVFDRGGRKFHGRLKALADAAREGGLRV